MTLCMLWNLESYWHLYFSANTRMAAMVCDNKGISMISDLCVIQWLDKCETLSQLPLTQGRDYLATRWPRMTWKWYFLTEVKELLSVYPRSMMQLAVCEKLWENIVMADIPDTLALRSLAGSLWMYMFYMCFHMNLFCIN